MQELDVDAASFSAHKIGGPKGVGALYLRTRTPYLPFMLGGGQEAGRRSGTQNVAGVVGFAAAAEAAIGRLEEESMRLRRLRDKLYAALACFPAIQATVEVEEGSFDYLPNIVHVLVDNLESETLVLRFDKLGFCVAGGSACSSHSLEPSHVLRAMGIAGDEAFNALRISMGTYTTEANIDALVAAFHEVLAW
jgi:cysteine desulfurase